MLKYIDVCISMLGCVCCVGMLLCMLVCMHAVCQCARMCAPGVRACVLNAGHTRRRRQSSRTSLLRTGGGVLGHPGQVSLLSNGIMSRPASTFRVDVLATHAGSVAVLSCDCFHFTRSTLIALPSIFLSPMFSSPRENTCQHALRFCISCVAAGGS